MSAFNSRTTFYSVWVEWNRKVDAVMKAMISVGPMKQLFVSRLWKKGPRHEFRHASYLQICEGLSQAERFTMLFMTTKHLL